MDALASVGTFFAPAVLVTTILAGLALIGFGIYGIYYNATDQPDSPNSGSDRTKGILTSVFIFGVGILMLPLSVSVYRSTLSDKKTAAYYGFLDIFQFFK